MKRKCFFSITLVSCLILSGYTYDRNTNPITVTDSIYNKNSEELQTQMLPYHPLEGPKSTVLDNENLPEIYQPKQTYPLFFMDTPAPLVGRDKIMVWVYESAWENFPTSVFESVLNWNNINSNIHVTPPVYGYLRSKDKIRKSQNLGDAYPQVNITGTTQLMDDILGATIRDSCHPSQQRIDLNLNKLPYESYEEKLHTVQHEMGHALGLNHPDKNLSSYPSIMWQTYIKYDNPYLYSYTIMEQDKYNLRNRW